jgi:hypothetical protein
MSSQHKQETKRKEVIVVVVVDAVGNKQQLDLARR